MLVRLDDRTYTRIAGRTQFAPRLTTRTGLRAGLSFGVDGKAADAQPRYPRCAAFFDGQNLFHAAKNAFGYAVPNFDPAVLAQLIARRHSWFLAGVHFYTGVPDVRDNPAWHEFWTEKLSVMGHRGVHVYMRKLRYANRTFVCPHGLECQRRVGREKGIDVRIALDMVRLARERVYDVALIFSQDQDLTEAVDEIKAVAREQNRWIKVACAFPSSPKSTNTRGIDGTDWIRIDRDMYNACLDRRDYGRRK